MNMHTYKFRNGGSNELKTEATMYAEGYECGATWDKFAPHNNYVPGGPYVYRDIACSRYTTADPEWIRFCKQSQRNHTAWMRGWHDGRKGVDHNPLPIDNFILGYN